MTRRSSRRPRWTSVPPTHYHRMLRATTRVRRPGAPRGPRLIDLETGVVGSRRYHRSKALVLVSSGTAHLQVRPLAAGRSWVHQRPGTLECAERILRKSLETPKARLGPCLWGREQAVTSRGGRSVAPVGSSAAPAATRSGRSGRRGSEDDAPGAAGDGSGSGGAGGSGREGPDRPLDDLAGPDARGAGVDPLGRSVHERPHPLDVRVPAPLGPAVRVADVHPERGLLATDVTHRCHDAPDPPRDCRAGAKG